MNKQKIQELIEQREEQRADIYRIERTDTTAFTINGHPYQLLIDYKNAFQTEKLADRFSTILSKYDYIVGDWGFDQLRLKGFYASQQGNGQPVVMVDAIQDYLYEYCNFGCAYFVIQNLDVQTVHPEHSRHRRGKKGSGSNNRSHDSHRNEARPAKKKAEGRDKQQGNHDNRKRSRKKATNSQTSKNQTTSHKTKKGPQIRERTTKVNPVAVEKRPHQEVVRKAGGKKQAKFVIRHK